MTPMTSAFQAPSPGVRDRRLLIGFIGAPALVAWALLAWWGSSPTGRLFYHQDASGRAGFLPLVLVGWVVMTTAMMLPTTAPLVRVFIQMTSDRSDRRRLISLLILGYAAVWTLVGALAIVGDDILHVVVRHAPALNDHRRRVAGGVFLLAGAYQFTPLKKRCLTSCRSPFAFVAQRWRGGRDAWNAFMLGADHGWFCVGCCWSLMVLMFAVGMANVGLMMLLGLVMAVEKNVARAKLLGPVLGVTLLGIACWLFASA
jgi:predicted metal-binding membrane protein